MNKRQHDEAYPKVVKDQHGEFCRHCERDLYDLRIEGNKPEFCIDHINNDNHDNRMANLQLLCHSCNTKKNHPRLTEPTERTMTPEMAFGRKYEKKFRKWVQGHYMANANIGLTYTFLLGSGAEAVECSPETIKRYLKKMASDEGMYEWEERYSESEPLLVLKKQYRE